MLVPVLPGRKADAAHWQSVGAIQHTSLGSVPRGKLVRSGWTQKSADDDLTVPPKHVRFAALEPDASHTDTRRVASPQPPFIWPAKSNSDQKSTSNYRRVKLATTVNHGGVPRNEYGGDMTEAGGVRSGNDERIEGYGEYEGKSIESEAAREEGEEEDGEDGESGREGDSEGEQAESENEVAHVPSPRQAQHGHLEMVHFHQVFRDGRELCWETDGHAFVDHEDPVYQHGGRAHRIRIEDQQHLDVMICDPDFCADCGAEEDRLSESSDGEKEGLPFVHSADLERTGKYLTYVPTPTPLLGSHKKCTRWMRSVCFQSNGPLVCKVLVCDFRECVVCLNQMQRPDEQTTRPRTNDQEHTHAPNERDTMQE